MINSAKRYKKGLFESLNRYERSPPQSNYGKYLFTDMHLTKGIHQGLWTITAGIQDKAVAPTSLPQLGMVES